jgi:conjugative relaxase-like TrwC/TraI family protein
MVLVGYSPQGERLAARQVDPARRVAALDLTFSAPKSVSLLYALGDEDVAKKVRDLHHHAVADALDYLERRALRERRGAGGAERIRTEGMVAASFLHRTSRAGDPQLHSHVLVANVALGEDGKWSAPYARLLYHHARTAGFLYQPERAPSCSFPPPPTMTASTENVNQFWLHRDHEFWPHPSLG